jgi:hypothetical protein
MFLNSFKENLIPKKRNTLVNYAVCLATHVEPI